MRVIKWLGLSVVGLVGVAFVTAAGAFWYVQNTDMAPWVVKLAKSQAGIEIQAEHLALKVWPEVHVQARKLVVPSLQGGGDMFRADDVDARVAWGSGWRFWQGVSVEELRLINPVVRLVRAADGVANWEMPSAAGTSATGGRAAGEAKATKATTLPVATFGMMDVQNLTLDYHDATNGQKVEVRKLNVQADGRTVGNASLVVDGLVNNQPLKGDMAFNFTDLSRVPLTANLNAAGLKVVLDGELRDQNAYAGAANIQADNLKAVLDSLLGKAPAQVPAEALRLTGDVVAGGERLVLRNFNASLGRLVQATGDVDVALGAKPSGKGQLMVRGGNLRQLVALGTGQPQPMLPERAFKFSVKLNGDDKIVLKDLHAELDGLMTLDGELDIVPPTKAGAMPALAGTLRMRAPSLKALAAAFGADAGNLPAQQVSVGFGISGKDTYTLRDVEAQLGTLATLKANLRVTPQPALKVAGDIALQGADVANAAKAFGISASLPRSPFDVAFKLGGTTRTELTDLRVNLPQLVEATGRVSALPQAPFDADVVLNIARLNADALGYCTSAAAGKAGASGAAAGGGAASGAAPWSDDALPWAGLKDIAFAADVTIARLDCSNFPARSVALKVSNNAQTLKVNKLDVAMPEDGSLNATLALGHTGQQAMEVALTTRKLPVHVLVSTLAEKGVVLPLDGTVNLTSRGASTRALAQNMAGNMTFTAPHGRVPYARMLGNLQAAASLLQGQLPTQGSDALRALNARFTVQNGVINTEEMVMQTDGLTLDGTGTVNLPAWLIDYRLTPRLAVADKLSLPVLVQGSLGAPNIGPDREVLSRFTSRLATEGLKGALGLDKGEAQGLGGAVGDLLEGRGLKGEGVQNLLRGVLAPKPAPTQPTPTPPASEEGGEGGAGEEPALPPATPQLNPANVLENFLGR